MRTHVPVGIFGLAAAALVAAAQGNDAMTWSVSRRSANENVWEATELITNSATGNFHRQRLVFVEMATGLNVPQPDGSFVAADPSFVINNAGGFADALNTRHHVRIYGDIAVPGAVSIITPSGEVLSANPIAIGYFDPVDQTYLVFATLTNSVGWLVSSNSIVFSNCFSGIRASMHFRNSVGGFSQTLVLQEAPNPPEAYGLSPSSCDEWSHGIHRWRISTP